MGLFGGETKDDKKARKEAELLAKYGLKDISSKDIESVKSIVSELAGNKWLETGAILSGASASDMAQTSCLEALVEQNWIIIRQLDRICKKLDA